MRLIDPRWCELEAGYRSVQALQARLEGEFGRALQAGQKRRFHRQLTEWQKKRRVFIALAVLAPLALIALCLSAFHFEQMACVLVYWVGVVIVILGALVVAGRQYIQEAMGRGPQPAPAREGAVDLTERWWQALAPVQPAAAGQARVPSFLAQLAAGLPESYLLIPPGGANLEELLLVGDSGLWLFAVRDWQGTIVKEEGNWKTIGKGRRGPVTPQPSAPDEQWLERRAALAARLREILPQHAWSAERVQGGVVFAHPQARPERDRIRDSRASYGPGRAWLERLRKAQAVEGFPLAVQLEVLEALGPGAPAGAEPVPAGREAERQYREAEAELRRLVAEMVA